MNTAVHDSPVAGADLHSINRTFHVLQSPMELLPNYYRWTYGRFRPWLTGTVVEVGCGAGLGLPVYLDQAERIIAVDHDDVLLERVRAISPKIETVNADLTAEHWREFEGLGADAVLMMDVLEHFADDEAFLRSSAEVLRPGGHILIKVPAGSSRYSAMDKASGHYRRYDAADLRRLAGNLGLEVVALTQFNRVGGLAYSMRNGRPKNFSGSFKPWQLKAINLALPLIRVADRLPLASGLSIDAVLRKPG